MRAGQDADLAVQFADLLVGAAVDAFAVEDEVADGALLEGRERGGEHRRGIRRLLALGQELCLHAGLECLDGVGALDLAGRQFGLGELVGEARLEDLDERVDLGGRVRLLGRQAAHLAKLLDHVDDDDDLLVGEHDRLEHLVLGHLAGEALDHRDRLARAGDDEVEVALLHLGGGRHDDQFVLDAADAHRAGDLEERDVRDVERSARADHAQDVGVVLAVGRHGRGHDLDFVDVVGGEERPDGPVDEAGGEDLLGRGPTLALEEAAGELARSVDLLAIIDGEREEILALADPALDGGGQGEGVAVAHGDGTVGLLGEFTGFEDEGLGPERTFDAKNLHGLIPPLARGRRAWSRGGDTRVREGCGIEDSTSRLG